MASPAMTQPDVTCVRREGREVVGALHLKSVVVHHDVIYTDLTH